MGKVLIESGEFSLPNKQEIKTQLTIDSESGKILSITTLNGGKHDFRLWKKNANKTPKNARILADWASSLPVGDGYQGITKIHKKSKTPIKKRGQKIDKKAQKI